MAVPMAIIKSNVLPNGKNIPTNPMIIMIQRPPNKLKLNISKHILFLTSLDVFFKLTKGTFH